MGGEGPRGGTAKGCPESPGLAYPAAEERAGRRHPASNALPPQGRPRAQRPTRRGGSPFPSAAGGRGGTRRRGRASAGGASSLAAAAAVGQG